MKKYRIKKLGMNYDNPLSDMSSFGDSREYFEGVSFNPPTEGNRFVLLNSIGGAVISTSPIVKIEEGKITTRYSVYSIEEL